VRVSGYQRTGRDVGGTPRERAVRWRSPWWRVGITAGS
jgi:hypothetical protein